MSSVNGRCVLTFDLTKQAKSFGVFSFTPTDGCTVHQKGHGHMKVLVNKINEGEHADTPPPCINERSSLLTAKPAGIVLTVASTRDFHAVTVRTQISD